MMLLRTYHYILPMNNPSCDMILIFTQGKINHATELVLNISVKNRNQTYSPSPDSKQAVAVTVSRSVPGLRW